MLTELLAAITETLLKAQLAAIKCLAQIVESSDNPAESRRAATTLLKLRLPKLEDFLAPAQPQAEGAPQPAAASSDYHHATTPLVPAELEALTALFPTNRPDTFNTHRSPSYWRQQLTQHNAVPPALLGRPVTTS